MKNRIVIEKLKDGHVVVDQQAERGVGGSSHDRRVHQHGTKKQKQVAAKKKQELTDEGWRRTDRKVFRSGVIEQMPTFPSTVEILPFGSAEIANIAAENEAVAADSTCFAFDTAAQIDAQNAAFVVKPPRRMRVVFVDEDAHVETNNQIDPLEYV